MEIAKKLVYDHPVVTPEIMINNNAGGVGIYFTTGILRTNNYDYGVVNFYVPPSAGNIAMRVDQMLAIQFEEQPPNDENGLTLYEYGNTSPHSISVGGETMEKEIVEGFFTDENIVCIYALSEGSDVNLLLVYQEEVEQLALRFAKIQNNISDKYPSHNIEILYIPIEVFSEDFIPDGAIPYRRG